MITYDNTKPFDQQTEEVQTYIRQEVIDIQAEPATRDELGRPAVSHYEFTDATETAYGVDVENVYISNASWALKAQRITVNAK